MNDFDGHSSDNLSAPQQWLAYELHDGLLQWIIAAKMQVAATINRTQENPQLSQADNLPSLIRISSLLEIAAEEGRSLIRFVDQVAPGPLDISELIDNFVHTLTTNTSITPEISITYLGSRWPRFSAPVAWTVFRLLQQAIQNAVSHSQASRIQVTFGWENESTIRAVVADNGIGFDPDQLFPNHFGLRSMRQRAHMCHGKLTIHSSPANGCEIILIAPCVTA